jgi:iron(III) transport system permease protein
VSSGIGMGDAAVKSGAASPFPMKRRGTRFEVWTWISLAVFLLYILFLVYPMFSVLRESILGEDGSLSFKYFSKFFGEKYYSQTLVNSFRISFAVTGLSLLLGVPLAYFYSMYEIRGRNFLQIVIILCSMSAPFIGAYSWILLLGRSGVITRFVEALTGLTMPSIYGFKGILLVLSTRLFPLVFLYVSGALRSIDNSLLEASLNLSCSGFRRFFRVVMPLCMPSVLAAALMVFMRALADFGTPMLIGEGYRTFPVEIYKQYVGETSVNHSFAAAISVVAIAITALVFLVQKYLSNHYSFSMSSMHPVERKKAKGLLNVAIHVFAYGLVSISMLPQVYVMYTSFLKTSGSGSVFEKGFSLNSYALAFKRMGSAIPNTLVISGISLFLIVLLAVLIAYLATRRRGPMNSAIDTLSMVPYIIPGSVVGIALVISFSQKPLVLTGTAAIMIIAMCIRRLPYTIRSSAAILQQIPVTVEEAAISLGASKLKTFFRITVPMMSNGIISGSILSWVAIITELSTSIILYNAKTITLTLGIYTLVSRGTEGPAAAVATILTVFTILSLLLFFKVSKSRDVVL